MKRYIISMLVCSIILVSCGTGVSKTSPEGWIDNDTFRVMGMGKAPEGMTDKFQREITSRKAAELDAKNRIVSKIVGSYIDSRSSTEMGVINEAVIKEVVSGRIRGVSIVQSKWDSKQNSTVVLELKSKNLKGEMDKLIESYLDEVNGKK